MKKRKRPATQWSHLGVSIDVTRKAKVAFLSRYYGKSRSAVVRQLIDSDYEEVQKLQRLLLETAAV